MIIVLIECGITVNTTGFFSLNLIFRPTFHDRLISFFFKHWFSPARSPRTCEARVSVNTATASVRHIGRHPRIPCWTTARLSCIPHHTWAFSAWPNSRQAPPGHPGLGRQHPSLLSHSPALSGILVSHLATVPYLGELTTPPPGNLGIPSHPPGQCLLISPPAFDKKPVGSV